MKSRKPKIAMIVLLLIATLFFSNNFGLIDIEKTAIVTAIGIDKRENGEYQVSLQIAVPEAANTTTENQKTQISATGTTVGNAIKNTANLTGWYPQTIFCNLIIIGESMLDENVVSVLDYFSKTYKVQDSALVVLSKEKASDLLKEATPLDNLSSFAIQKILLKNPGFDKDVYAVDVKTFCEGYFSDDKSSFMPLIKTVCSNQEGTAQTQEEPKSKGESTTEQSPKDSGQTDKKTSNTVFDATTTALFLKGKKVGELDRNLTHAFSLLTTKANGSTFPINQVTNENGILCNYQLAVMKNKRSITVKATNNELKVVAKVDLYCKISDENSGNSSLSLSQNQPLPNHLKIKAEQTIANDVRQLFEIERETGCDFLKIKEKLYRFNYNQYSLYKENYLDKMQVEVFVTVNGQL